MRLILFLVLLLGSVSLPAQPQLTLLKRNNIITRFEEGEAIRFKRRGDKIFTKAVIQGIHPGFITIAEDTINFYDIGEIDIRRKPLSTFKISVMGRTLIVAGASIFLIDFFNQKIVQDKEYEADSGITTGGLILIGTGGMMQVFNNDYFKNRGRRKLGVIDR